MRCQGHWTCAQHREELGRRQVAEYSRAPSNRYQNGKHTFRRSLGFRCARGSRLINTSFNMLQCIPQICTQELKVKTMRRYLLSIGCEHWTNTIGIRADEAKRVKKSKDKRWDNWFPWQMQGSRSKMLCSSGTTRVRFEDYPGIREL